MAIRGEIKYRDGSRYVGYHVGGTPHGHGTLHYADGTNYCGSFANGKKHGYGDESFINGDRYSGEHQNGYRSGWGCYYYKNGDRYEGNWLNGKKHGGGCYHYANGDMFSGTWANGKRHGKGALIRKGGRFSIAEEWYEGVKLETTGASYDRVPKAPAAPAPTPTRSTGHDINPIARLKTMDRYSGPKKNGLPHTENGETGFYEYENGDYYKGSFKNGRIEGYGTMIYKRRGGEYYVGEWKGGRYHGKGKICFAGGSGYLDGHFENGNASGQCFFKTKVRDSYLGEATYKGEYKNGKKHGKGVYKYADGSEYNGDWYEGKRHGYGQFSDRPHGSCYTGEWKDDKRHGRGRCVYFYDKKTPIQDGTWSNDRFLG